LNDGIPAVPINRQPNLICGFHYSVTRPKLFGTGHSQELVNIDQFSVLGTWYDCVLCRAASCWEPKWDELYMRTILKVNGHRMPERITVTRQAISGRLHDLEHDSDHHAERQQIENALKALSVLEIETQGW
jgi:hypothetical protein